MIIKVTNGNSFGFTDMYDGIPYQFPAGQSVKVPLEAAAHFFGFPNAVDEETNEARLVPIADFRYVARRYGWDTPAAPKNKDERPDVDAQFRLAKQWFDALAIEVRRQVIVDEPMDGDTLPAPRGGGAMPEAVEDEVHLPEEATRQKRRYKARGGAAAKKARLANLAKATAARAAKRAAALRGAALPETAGDLASDPDAAGEAM